jgi:radical SAM protein with 4Fe4S-binding SPASM domain
VLPYSQLREQKRLNLAAGVPLSGPLTVYVEPTSVCNFNCSFCPVSLPAYKQKPDAFLGMELYRKILVDLLPFAPIKALKLYMLGEPFLHPEICEMVRLARAFKVAERIEITTNGSALPEDILDSGLDYLRVSVYAPGPNQIFRNVRRLMERRTNLVPFISAKYMPTTTADCLEFERIWTGQVDEIAVEPYHNWASTLLTPTPRTKKNCPYPHYTLAIRANGDVMPCCVDWSGKLKLGNVRNRSLREIWNGEARGKLVTIHSSGTRSCLDACRDCNFPETSPDDLDSLDAR